MADIVVVPADPNGGPVTVTLVLADYPQGAAALVWRYKPDSTPFPKPAAKIVPPSNSAPIGSLPDIQDNYFKLEGAVMPNDDDPPTPYRMLVPVTQGDKVLDPDISRGKVSGNIGSDPAAFSCTFQIVLETPV